MTKGDVVAGASVALVLLPQSLAYAELAGLPAHYGLYAATLPPIAAAFFASSPYLQTGPVAVTALLVFGALVQLAVPGSAGYAGLAALLALLVGLIRVAFGLFGAGAVAYLLSQPLLIGFMTGAAVLIVASQLPGAVGLAGGAGVLQAAARTLTAPAAWNVAALALAATTVVVILAGRHLRPRLPWVPLAAAIGLAASHLGGYAGPVIGEVPAAWPHLSVELPWAAVPRLLMPAFVIALVGFAEPASIARTFAAQDRARWNPDREFVSQGMANIAAGLSGGFPVGGSFSRTSLNRLAGARTRWSGAVTGIVMIALLPLAGLLAALPRAVLSGIVIASVLGLIQVRPLAGIWQISKPQFMVAFATFVLTLVLSPHVEEAVVAGMLLAAAVHLWRERHVDLRSWTEGAALHMEPRGVLWFGSAPEIEHVFLDRLTRSDGVQELVVHLRGLGRIDLTGALVIKELLGAARSAGLAVRLEDVPPHAERILSRTLGWSGTPRPAPSPPGPRPEPEPREED